MGEVCFAIVQLTGCCLVLGNTGCIKSKTKGAAKGCERGNEGMKG